MNTRTLLISAGIGVLALGSLSFAAVNGKMAKGGDFSAVKTAVEANKYASLPDAAKSKITEAEFAEMVQKHMEHTTIENAVIAGDYTAFKNAMVAQIPTEAEFQKIVAAHKARTETQTKIETAVKNNDFSAFKIAVEAQRAAMVANHPGDDAPKAPTDAELQKHFTTLVDYYKTNGKLPDVGGPGSGPMGKWMKGDKWMGGHGPRGEGRRGE